MPSSKPRKRSGRGEVVPPLSKLSKIGELLQVQVETFPQKELTPEEVERWDRDLSNYPIEAIEYAFDNHRRLAMFFPVPAQILDLCQSYLPTVRDPNACDAECRSRHGKGYGELDMQHLWKTFTAKRVKLNRQLNATEFEMLLQELDKARGQVPEWRAA